MERNAMVAWWHGGTVAPIDYLIDITIENEVSLT
jgi:hypothetical protein